MEPEVDALLHIAKFGESNIPPTNRWYNANITDPYDTKDLIETYGPLFQWEEIYNKLRADPKGLTISGVTLAEAKNRNLPALNSINILGSFPNWIKSLYHRHSIPFFLGITKIEQLNILNDTLTELHKQHGGYKINEAQTKYYYMTEKKTPKTI